MNYENPTPKRKASKKTAKPNVNYHDIGVGIRHVPATDIIEDTKDHVSSSDYDQLMQKYKKLMASYDKLSGQFDQAMDLVERTQSNFNQMREIADEAIRERDMLLDICESYDRQQSSTERGIRELDRLDKDNDPYLISASYRPGEGIKIKERPKYKYTGLDVKYDPVTGRGMLRIKRERKN